MKKLFIVIFSLSLFILSCSNDTEKVDLNFIDFEKKDVTVSIGQSIACPVLYGPEGSEIDLVKLSYKILPDDLCEILIPDVSGCVLKGSTKGSGVLSVSYDNYISYCQVYVEGALVSKEPYILLPEHDIKMDIGKNRTVTANLVGCSSEDLNNFNWQSSESSVVSVEYSGATAVLTAKKYGSSTITVSNPSCLYDANILVIVNEREGDFFYLTTDSNVINLKKGENCDFTVKCVGGNEEDLSQIKYVISEDEDKFEISGSGEKCSVKALNEGQGQIEIIHPKSKVSLKVLINVGTSDDEDHIVCENDFIVFNDKESKSIECSLYSKNTGGWDYEIDGEDCTDIVLYNSTFVIKPVKKGICNLIIKNKNVENDKVVRIVVDDIFSENDYYRIRTQNNVIKIEEGDTDIPLVMELLGGNEYDKNSFEWEVGDSQIIKVEAVDGNVKYARNAADENLITGKAYISAVNTGKTQIKIYHPKSENECNVDVFVYPKGTFEKQLDNPSGKKFVKAVIGTEYEYELSGVSDFNKLTVSASDPSVLLCYIKENKIYYKALKSGNAYFTINSQLFINPYNVNVFCGNESEIENCKTIECNIENISGFEGNSVYFEIKGEFENGYPQFNISYEDENICSLSYVNNIFAAELKKPGSQIIRISAAGFSNVLYIPVFVKQTETDSRYPYYFYGDSFIKSYIDGKSSCSLVVSGASIDESLECEFEYDSNKVKLNYDGKNLYVEGKKEGSGEITVTHEKVKEEKKIKYIIYSTKEESDKSIFLWTENSYYSGVKGNKILVKINSSSDKIKEYNVNISDIEITRCEKEGNYLLFTLIKEGTANVKVWIDENTSCMFDINVVPSDFKEINENSFECDIYSESVINQFSYINLSFYGKCNSNDIKFSVPECISGSISGNKFRYIGTEKGVFEILFECEKYDIKKKCIISIYESENEKKNKPSVYLDKYEYNLYENESITLNAILTSKNTDDNILSSIKWECNESGLEIINNGLNCEIKALRQGVYNLVIKSNYLFNEFKFTVYVAADNNNFNSFVFNRRIFIKKGEVKSFNFNFENNYNSNNDYNNVSVFCDKEGLDTKITGNTIAFYSEKEGEYYCTLKKTGFNDYKFLVCCSENDESEDKPYFFLSGEVFILDKGSVSEVCVFTNINEEFTVSLSGEECVKIEKNNEGIKLNGIKNGKCTVAIKCRDFIRVITVIVNDKDNKTINNIKAENVIYLQKDEQRITQVYSENTVTFKCNDNNLEINPEGNSCYIKSDKCGIYELIIQNNSYENYAIRVYVYDDSINQNNIEGFNILKRSNILYKGEKIDFKVYIEKGDYDNVIFETDNNNVADINYQDGRFTIKGTEEGYFVLKVKYKEQKINICFSVLNREVNKEERIKSKDYYLSGENPYNYIGIDEAVILKTKIYDFNGECEDNIKNCIWQTSDNDIVNIISYDKECAVRGISKGRAVIWCSNPDCSNIISFTVDIGTSEDKFKSTYKYIYVENSVVSFDYNDRTVSFNAKLNNLEIKNSSLINLYFDDESICSADCVINEDEVTVNLMALKCGKTVLHIFTPEADFETNVTVIVSYKIQGAQPYLTTYNNYNLIRKGQTARVSVDLINFDEYDASNFIWEKLSGNECVTIIGNGENVQIYGVNEGLCHIKVSHIPSGSKIEIYVQVSDSVKSVKYMTTKNLVIETGTSNVMESFTCEIIGGVIEDEDGYAITVDRPDIISVIQNGKNFFYRGLKEGNAKLHITNTKSGCINSLDVIFIVSEQVSGPAMKVDKSAVYLKKGEAAKSVSVSFENTDNYDENLIDWFIYSNIPSKNDKNVISIISSGSHCVVKPEGEGYASVRAYYQPLGISASFGVYVDEVGKVSFKNDNIKLTKGDNAFVEMKVPDYIDDISNYVTYTSLDESVCKAFGTGKVCCIESVEEGSCIVRVVNTYDDTVCELGVTVTKNDENIPAILLKSDTLLLNPRSENQILYATVSGKGVGKDSYDNILWEIESDTSGCLSLYPKNGENVQLRLNPCNDLQDSDYGRVKCGQAVIKVSHPSCPVSRTIYVNINELDNFFTLEKYSLNLGQSESQTLKCNISGGRESDYSKVKWSVNGQNTDQFGTRVDVCRLMVSDGEETTIYGLNEGTCIVTAFYLGYAVSCEVNVTSDRIFRLNGASTVKMFPDKSEENYTDVAYICRPKSQLPQWTVQNLDGSSEDILLTVEQISGNEKIRLRPNGKEGRVKVIGFVIGCGQVSFNVELKFEPDLRITDGEDSYDLILDEDKENEKVIKFSSYPSQYYVGIELNGTYKDYVQAFIEDTKKKGDYLEGSIRFKVLKEFPQNGCTLKIQQYKDASCTSYYRVNNERSYVNISICGHYEDNGIQLGFRRGSGGFSMRQQTQEAAALYNVSNKFINENNNSYYKFYDSNDVNNISIDLADSEQHYFILKKRHDNSYMENIKIEISGTPNNFNIVNLLAEGTANLSNINDKAIEAKPVINEYTNNGNGSIVFDIKTGEQNMKYGINWNIKDKGSVSYIPPVANRYYCNYLCFPLPSVQVNGKTVCITDLNFDIYDYYGKRFYYFKIPGDSNYYIYNIEDNNIKFDEVTEKLIDSYYTIEDNYIYKEDTGREKKQFIIGDEGPYPKESRYPYDLNHWNTYDRYLKRYLYTLRAYDNRIKEYITPAYTLNDIQSKYWYNPSIEFIADVSTKTGKLIKESDVSGHIIKCTSNGSFTKDYYGNYSSLIIDCDADENDFDNETKVSKGNYTISTRLYKDKSTNKYFCIMKLDSTKGIKYRIFEVGNGWDNNKDVYDEIENDENYLFFNVRRRNSKGESFCCNELFWLFYYPDNNDNMYIMAEEDIKKRGDFYISDLYDDEEDNDRYSYYENLLPNPKYWCKGDKESTKKIFKECPELSGSFENFYLPGEYDIYKIDNFNNIGGYVNDLFYGAFEELENKKGKVKILYNNNYYFNTYISYINNGYCNFENGFDRDWQPFSNKDINEIKIDQNGKEFLRKDFSEIARNYLYKKDYFYAYYTCTKSSPDFWYSGCNLKISWTGYNGERSISVPINLYFYNNHKDFYTYINGVQKENYLNVNENIEDYDLNK